MTEESLTWLVAMPFHLICSSIPNPSAIYFSYDVGLYERKGTRSPPLLASSVLVLFLLDVSFFVEKISIAMLTVAAVVMIVPNNH